MAKWREASGSERANYQLFITELCELLCVAKPDPSREDTRDNAYVFERRVRFAYGDGSESHGFIDCNKRGHFVLEAKKPKVSEEKIALHFKGRGPWKRRLPQIIDTLVALGPARKSGSKVRAV